MVFPVVNLSRTEGAVPFLRVGIVDCLGPSIRLSAVEVLSPIEYSNGFSSGDPSDSLSGITGAGCRGGYAMVSVASRCFLEDVVCL